MRKAVGELGVLTEETVTWVNGLSFGVLHSSMLRRVNTLERLKSHLSPTPVADLDDFVYTELRK